MKAEATKLEGCFILHPKVFEDSRGYFYESFNQEKFEALTGMNGDFVQDNQSLSKFGTIRGLHFQKGNSAQAKLVRVLDGEVLDVAVDLRENSPTFKEWVAVKLTTENKCQLYIPRGFAHGFAVLSPTAIFAYKCDNYYDKQSESGIRFDDTALGIDWMLPQDKILLSEKDLALPFL